MSSAPEVNPSTSAAPGEAKEQNVATNNDAPDIINDRNLAADQSIAELNSSMHEVLRLMNDLQGRQSILEQNQACFEPC